MRSLLYFMVLLSLPACRVITDPTYMPAGYSYHHELYKSPPGPKAASIGYEYSAAQNAQVVKMWEVNVQDLIRKLEQNRGELPEILYIEPVDHANAFNMTFDHVLRKELRSRGHVLSSYPGDHLTLVLGAYDPDWSGKREKQEYNDDLTYETGEYLHKKTKNIILTLSTRRVGIPLERVSGEYVMPLYGYSRDKWYEGEASIKPEDLVMENGMAAENEMAMEKDTAMENEMAAENEMVMEKDTAMEKGGSMTGYEENSY